MNSLSSYPSIYAIGHKAIQNIFESDVIVEEKIDGSQFSFGTHKGELFCRSKGQSLIIEEPEKLFAKAVQVVKTLDLREGWTYRAEYLRTPKHNTLAYGRIPNNHIIIFDIETSVQTFLSHEGKYHEAQRLGLECVPALFQGKVENLDQFKTFLEKDSVLGGCKVEGVVVKNYNIFTDRKQIAVGKFVSEAFKEKHTTEWKKTNPGRQDVIELLVQEYKTDARWRKAIQHLRDDGKLEGSPRDIGNLIREVPEDILKESGEEIKIRLFDFFWPHIRRGVIRGFPEFYKEELAKNAFTPTAP